MCSFQVLRDHAPSFLIDFIRSAEPMERDPKLHGGGHLLASVGVPDGGCSHAPTQRTSVTAESGMCTMQLGLKEIGSMLPSADLVGWAMRSWLKCPSARGGDPGTAVWR